MRKQPKLKDRQQPNASRSLFSWCLDYNNVLFKGMLDSATSLSPLMEKTSQTLFDAFSPGSLAIFDPQIVFDTIADAQSHFITQVKNEPALICDIYEDYTRQLCQLTENMYQRFEGQPAEVVIAPNPRDKRFRDLAWEQNPYFDFIKQVYLLQAKFLSDIVQSLKGLSPETHQKIGFYAQHFIDAMSPTNFVMTNPSVLRETILTQGENLRRGILNLMRDLSAEGKSKASSVFQLGKNIATTPGKVVFQNDFFQLIQYLPTTDSVNEIPLLIIPPWINKYYIFDLTEENSFVRWALNAGLTVFIVSWINPDERHAQKSFEHYVLDGVGEAVRRVCDIAEVSEINTIGYCAGGVALVSLMGYLAGKKHSPIKSSTVIATPIDMHQAGGVLVYTCEQQLKKLEAYMYKKGYLPGKSMEMSFNMLRANDMIWSTYVTNYLLGKESSAFDILHWNSDSTRMPARMHSEYLRNFFLENRLMKRGRKALRIGNERLDISRIETPIFVFGTAEDHIAPWQSVFPLVHLTSGPTKFILGGSGHVAGVINHPSRQKYGYWMSDSTSRDPHQWFQKAEKKTGSWWPEWYQWLEPYCGGTVKARIPKTKGVIEDAPGSYALTMSE